MTEHKFLFINKQFAGIQDVQPESIELIQASFGKQSGVLRLTLSDFDLKNWFSRYLPREGVPSVAFDIEIKTGVSPSDCKPVTRFYDCHVLIDHQQWQHVRDVLYSPTRKLSEPDLFWLPVMFSDSWFDVGEENRCE